MGYNQRIYFSTPGDHTWEEVAKGFWVETEERKWPISREERARLAFLHEPEASASPDGFRLATCVVPMCKRPMVAMWHLWVDWTEIPAMTASAGQPPTRIVKEIHMCHACATDIYGAPHPLVSELAAEAESLALQEGLDAS